MAKKSRTPKENKSVCVKQSRKTTKEEEMEGKEMKNDKKEEKKCK